MGERRRRHPIGYSRFERFDLEIRLYFPAACAHVTCDTCIMVPPLQRRGWQRVAIEICRSRARAQGTINMSKLRKLRQPSTYPSAQLRNLRRTYVAVVCLRNWRRGHVNAAAGTYPMLRVTYLRAGIRNATSFTCCADVSYVTASTGTAILPRRPQAAPSLSIETRRRLSGCGRRARAP